MFAFDLETESDYGHTPILKACANGSLEIVKLILSSVPNPLKLLEIKPDPVRIAKPEIARYLVDFKRILRNRQRKVTRKQRRDVKRK